MAEYTSGNSSKNESYGLSLLRLPPGSGTPGALDQLASREGWRSVSLTGVVRSTTYVIDLPAVVNFDLPRSTADYVHRIGRTGRAGASGVAVSFVSAATEAHFRLIEKRNRIRLMRERIPGFEPVATSPAARSKP